MTSFSEFSVQVHRIKDMILTDMVYDVEATDDSLAFSKHLHCTKFWFARTSFANKKRYLLCLLNDIKSAWALSWILKSIWNCNAKDAILSVSEPHTLSSYDMVPMDHNRTAVPISTLAQAMATDRKWFHTLQPEAQAAVLTELLTISGCAIMLSVYNRAHVIYSRYRQHQLQALMESIEHASTRDSAKNKSLQQLQKSKSKLKMNLVNVETDPPFLQPWNEALKLIRDRLSLEEIEVEFKDGSTKKIWKVNRTKPESIEAVDFIQLLPSTIGKMILAYFSQDQLSVCAQVNKYWAFLIDELKAEKAARVKIDAVMEKLQGLMFRHDSYPEHQFTTPEAPLSMTTLSARKHTMTIASQQTKYSVKSVKSTRSGNTMLRTITEQVLKSNKQRQYEPVCTMAELRGRLDKCGAADENIFQWCDNIVTQARRRRRQAARAVHDNNKPNKYKPSIPIMTDDPKPRTEGVLPSVGMFFPCPLLKKHLDVPMEPPLTKDPTYSSAVPLKRNISNIAGVSNGPPDLSQKHIGLWSKDFSSLYHVYKIPSHLSPL